MEEKVKGIFDIYDRFRFADELGFVFARADLFR